MRDIERGYLNGNHFVYRDKKPVLIDSAFILDFLDTERLISSLGVNLSRIDLIVCTHTHCDHIGGNGIIQDRSGCKIALHNTGKYFIDTRMTGRHGGGIMIRRPGFLTTQYLWKMEII
ncbi:beta-lactamase-like [hydrocarbon metagenome]|uniref:Beta-lactamase-like n=1 Tax=hydrocarbon metagenome TaxID=938273 RepID=A0A0W8E2N6_9ZZZZ